MLRSGPLKKNIFWQVLFRIRQEHCIVQSKFSTWQKRRRAGGGFSRTLPGSRPCQGALRQMFSVRPSIDKTDDALNLITRSGGQLRLWTKVNVPNQSQGVRAQLRGEHCSAAPAPHRTASR